MLPPIRVNRHASGTWFRLAENQMRAAIGSCGDVPAVLRPEIPSANDRRTIKTTQPVPAGVQIEALLGLFLVRCVFYEIIAGDQEG
jgi:hypothetical protein